ncbi:hypothetical protein FA15DRAFT_197295 [Coprinopsis marcescibilis]|uniref:Uncharacterized protein n=1 Tax=Coprinopsis marcescibilis TaxID=230819 RepID=A0A5C3LCB6_COPMA|nr:hypothetical protein FA15DRAFT_197295 [Coprinopsis marcescibilis]
MAQISMATCSMSDNWGFNSAGQSPCEIGSALGGVCTGGSFILPELPPNNQYQGPNSTVQNSCRCSSVYYSLLSACAYCQGRNYIRWSSYKANCDVVYEGSFPQPIPIGLVVPGWAYQDVKTRDTFNASLVTSIGQGDHLIYANM